MQLRQQTLFINDETPWQSIEPVESQKTSIMADRLFLRKGNIFHCVNMKDIVLLEADKNYTTIYTKWDRYIYSTVLKQMENKLSNSCFMRVHRSYLVNLEAITGFEGNLLHLGEHRVPVSRSFRQDVFQLFNVI